MRLTSIAGGLLRGGLLPMLVPVLLSVLLHSEAKSQGPATTPDDPLVINLEDIEWGPPGNTPRFAQGTQTAQLGTDPDSGGPIYYAKFPAGSHFDLHWHSHTEYVSVLSGNVTFVLGEETHSLSPGSYVVIPARMNHSWDVPSGGPDAVILVRRRGPADFNFVER